MKNNNKKTFESFKIKMCNSRMFNVYFIFAYFFAALFNASAYDCKSKHFDGEIT